MLIEKLDRTRWRLIQAVEHIAAQIRNAAEVARAAADQAVALSTATPAWMRAANPDAAAKERAESEVQIALRDGDLRAVGRLSTTRSARWAQPAVGWEMHSGHFTAISRIVWLRACGRPWKAVCWEVGLARAAAHQHWMFALCVISWRLNGRTVSRHVSRRNLIAESRRANA